MNEEGLDSDGRGFSNAKEMWREEIGCTGKEGVAEATASNGGADGKRSEWYQKGISYWQGVEASVDGVLGGYGHVNDVDVKGSGDFLKILLPERFGRERRHLVALDCGAGIGRVTKNLLLTFFNEVDLVEPVLHFMESARKNLTSENNVAQDSHRAVNFFCLPLQEFTPQPGRYDVIWVQWCIGQLPDDDFVAFFKRAKDAVKDNGLIILKENIARNGFVLDKEDKSITRSDAYFKELFHQCGLHIYKMKEQKGLPEELFAVKMYALVANKDNVKKRRAGIGEPMRSHRPALIK